MLHFSKGEKDMKNAVKVRQSRCNNCAFLARNSCGMYIPARYRPDATIAKKIDIPCHMLGEPRAKLDANDTM